MKIHKKRLYMRLYREIYSVGVTVCEKYTVKPGSVTKNARLSILSLHLLFYAFQKDDTSSVMDLKW